MFNNGNVYTFGNNGKGQLGIGADTDTLRYTHIPQKVEIPPCTKISSGDYFIICLDENELVYSFGNNDCGQLGLGNDQESFNSPQLVSSLKNVEFVECGQRHVFCKTLNNEIYCWGYNHHDN